MVFSEDLVSLETMLAFIERRSCIKVFIFCWELLEACSHMYRLLALYDHAHSKHFTCQHFQLFYILSYIVLQQNMVIYCKCAWWFCRLPRVHIVTQKMQIRAPSRTLLELHIYNWTSSICIWVQQYRICLNVLLSMALRMITIHSIAIYKHI